MALSIDDIFTQHTAQGVQNRDFFKAQDRRRIEDDLLRLVELGQSRHGIRSFH